MNKKEILYQILAECLCDLEDVGIYIDADIKVDVATFKSRNGDVRKLDSHTYHVRIAEFLIVEDCKYATNCMMHELLHIVAGVGTGHKGKWKTLANKVNNAFDGKYQIQRCTTYPVERPAVTHNKTYVLVCEKCGKKIIRHKMSNFVKNPSRYRHKSCLGNFKLVASS